MNSASIAPGWVPVAASEDEAELLRGRLESAGVHAVCFDAGMNIAESVGLMIPVRVIEPPMPRLRAAPRRASSSRTLATRGAVSRRKAADWRSPARAPSRQA